MTALGGQLCSKVSRLEITALNQLIRQDEKPYRLHAGKTRVAFPPTCPPPLVQPHLSLKQHAEQGVNFILTLP